jgi:Methyladenine glycosylase
VNVSGRAAAPTAAAAFSIKSTTSSGWETIATWLEGISTVVAPTRDANMRSASGGIASSFCATRYQAGSDRHAGTPMTSVKAEDASGCCAAYNTRARVGSTSAAKWSTKSSSESRSRASRSSGRPGRRAPGADARRRRRARSTGTAAPAPGSPPLGRARSRRSRARRAVAGLPSSTPQAEAFAKYLKSQGHRFVGPTSVYAFMQNVGVVNDHIRGCFRAIEMA